MPNDTWFNLPEDKRRRVLDAALVEFGQRGYGAGSLNVIARDAKVAKGSLFQYFADKLDLWAAVVEHGSARAVEHLTAGIERRGPLPFFDQFRAMAADWIALLKKDEVLRCGMIALVREVDDAARRVGRGDTNRHFESVFDGLLKRAVADGEFRAGADPIVVLWQGITLLRHLVVAAHLSGEDPSLDLGAVSTRTFNRRVAAILDGYERAWSAVAP